MFRFRRKKKGLRTPDNYSDAQMNADHLATTAIVTATFGHEPVDEDEQREEAEADLDDVEQSQAEAEADVPDDVVDSSGGTYTAGSHGATQDNVNEFYQPTYDSSPSYDSTSYDGGSSTSYDSGGGGYSDGGSY